MLVIRFFVCFLFVFLLLFFHSEVHIVKGTDYVDNWGRWRLALDLNRLRLWCSRRQSLESRLHRAAVSEKLFEWNILLISGVRRE